MPPPSDVWHVFSFLKYNFFFNSPELKDQLCFFDQHQTWHREASLAEGSSSLFRNGGPQPKKRGGDNLKNVKYM